MPKKRPTSQDVASLAGVSRATVSYVLNGSTVQSIPEKTRARVWEAARQLGYTPHAAARALRAGRSSIVLLVVRDIPYGRNLGVAVDWLADQVARRDLTLLVWEPGAGTSLRTVLAHLQPRLTLSFFPLDDDEAAALAVAGIPYAAAFPTRGDSGIDELVGAVQAHHLAQQGHRVIGSLGTGDADVAAFAGPRRRGVRRGCLELGLPAPAEAAVAVPPRGSLADVVQVLARWRAADPPVTGVAAYNDHLAARCLGAARTLGLRVPEEVAVIGVDDDPMDTLLEPALTTVGIDMEALAGHLLARGLAAAGEGEPPLPPPSAALRLIPRDST